MPNKGPGGRTAALVTGAAYGIGAAAAVGLAKDGFDVAVTELRIEDLADTIGEIGTTGAAGVPIALDVRSPGSIDQAFRAAIAAFGHLDVLVNNAGVPSLGKPAFDITRAEWDSVVGVNLTGTFFMTQQMGRHLIECGRPGAIISVASTHGLVGFAGASAYGIAKAGISHMARMLAIEWAQHGIRVNAIAPGTTETKTRAPRLSDSAYRKRMLERIPAGRFGTADDMAAAIRYLASAQAAYITGQTLVVDGGLTAG
jgi:NAD(P)-dependent dehydrogenase (short-subunit alcohol dehydrogenase family)